MNKVSVGAMLILREEFRVVAQDDSASSAVRKRAQALVLMIDELIAFREWEHARTVPQNEEAPNASA